MVDNSKQITYFINMTRKHFKMVAATLLAIKNKKEREHLAKSYIVTFKQANPRFDETKFRAACELN